MARSVWTPSLAARPSAPGGGAPSGSGARPRAGIRRPLGLPQRLPLAWGGAAASEAPRARGSDRGRRAKPRSVRGCGPASRFELSATEPLCLFAQSEAPARRTRRRAQHL